MKKKYTAAALLITVAASSAVTYELANASDLAHANARNSETGQLRMLDAQLAEKVSEFLELSDLLTAQLEQARSVEGRKVLQPLLVGNAPEPVVATATPAKPAAKPAARPRKPAPPWWTPYQVSMIVFSNGARSAVINGHYVRTGDTVAPGISVHAVNPDNVVLQRSGKRATLVME